MIRPLSVVASAFPGWKEWGFFLIVKRKLTAPYYNEEGLTALALRAGEDPGGPTIDRVRPPLGRTRGAKRWLLVLKVLRLPAGVFSWRI